MWLDFFLDIETDVLLKESNLGQGTGEKALAALILLLTTSSLFR